MMRRPLRIARAGLVVAIVAPLTWVACSGSSPSDAALDLCRDLVHLRATVELLIDPGLEMRVGEIREALEKLGPTSNTLGASVVTDRLQADFFRAEDGYRAAIDGVGDDETIVAARIDVAGHGTSLGAAYQAIVASLNCAQLLSGAA
jgi:hypothetical protein